MTFSVGLRSVGKQLLLLIIIVDNILEICYQDIAVPILSCLQEVKIKLSITTEVQISV